MARYFARSSHGEPRGLLLGSRPLSLAPHADPEDVYRCTGTTRRLMLHDLEDVGIAPHGHHVSSAVRLLSTIAGSGCGSSTCSCDVSRSKLCTLGQVVHLCRLPALADGAVTCEARRHVDLALGEVGRQPDPGRLRLPGISAVTCDGRALLVPQADDMCPRPGRHELRAIFWVEQQVTADERRATAVARLARLVEKPPGLDRTRLLTALAELAGRCAPQPIPHFSAVLAGLQ